MYSVYSHRFYLLFSFFFSWNSLLSYPFETPFPLSLALFCARKCIIWHCYEKMHNYLILKILWNLKFEEILCWLNKYCAFQNDSNIKMSSVKIFFFHPWKRFMKFYTSSLCRNLSFRMPFFNANSLNFSLLVISMCHLINFIMFNWLWTPVLVGGITQCIKWTF